MEIVERGETAVIGIEVVAYFGQLGVPGHDVGDLRA